MGSDLRVLTPFVRVHLALACGAWDAPPCWFAATPAHGRSEHGRSIGRGWQRHGERGARPLSRHAGRAARSRQRARRDARRGRAPGTARDPVPGQCRRFPPRAGCGGQAMTDLAQLSARALAAAIRDKKVSSLEATKAAIQRLTAAHELTHCIVSLEAADALDAARTVDAALPGGGPVGALAGVPLAHKDMFDRRDKIASWGANIRADAPPARDAAAIAALKGAGALQIATLHLTEFAYGPTGHNYVLGHARN